MAVTNIPGFTPTVTSSSTGTKGVNDMTGEDFIKVMITQLQQQDPLDPSKSDQLLTQMSQISQLQSNQALKQSLEGLTLQQSIGAGGNLIGKTVNGIDEGGDKVEGIVTAVKVQDKAVYLELDSGKQLPLGNVTDIAQKSGSSSAMQALLAQPQVQQLLSQLGLSGSNLTQDQLSQILASPQGQAMLSAISQQQAGATAQPAQASPSGGPLSGLLSLAGL